MRILPFWIASAVARFEAQLFSMFLNWGNTTAKMTAIIAREIIISNIVKALCSRILFFCFDFIELLVSGNVLNIIQVLKVKAISRHPLKDRVLSQL